MHKSTENDVKIAIIKVPLEIPIKVPLEIPIKVL